MLAWALFWACTPPPTVHRRPPSAPPTVAAPPSWPEPGALLDVLPTLAPRGLGRPTIYLSAGHYNGGKRGNIGVHGQVEAHVNRDTVLDLARRLEALDRYTLVVSRRGEQRPSYSARIQDAKNHGADVFIELHTDARGEVAWFADTPSDGPTLMAEGDAGFAVLYNPGGVLGPERGRLGARMAESLAAAGFPPYPGCHYGGLYDLASTPGLFIDLRGLMMLRRPTMPSIIVETHNAKDFEESLRWREEATLEAFAAAVDDALTRYFLEPQPT